MSCDPTNPVVFLAGERSPFLTLIAKKLSDAGFQISVTSAQVLTGDFPEGKTHVCPARVDDMAELSAAVISTAERFGRIDWLIHCQQKHSRAGMILDTDDMQWDDVVSSWLRGVFFTCKCGIPYVMGSPDGRFLVFSEEDSENAPIHEKTRMGGLQAFIDQAQKELEPVGIHVEKLLFGIDQEVDNLIKKCPLL